jgi:hypothetical protein
MKLIRILAVFLIFAGGCTFDDCCYYEWERYEKRLAEVIYSGAPEVDGCGWLIRISDRLYHPVNLHDDYKKENLPVVIEFMRTGRIYRCGIGGTPYTSIRIFNIDTLKFKNEVGILHEHQYDKLEMDGFRLDSAYVKGDTMHLKVGYSGGCRKHIFKLWKLPSTSSANQKTELLLDHDSNGDMCEAWISEWLEFSLKPIRIPGKNSVTVLLRGSPEMSAYFGEYIYSY